MKQIILLTLCTLFAFTSAGKKKSDGRLDKRPFAERRADYHKVERYPSGFTEANFIGETLYMDGDTVLIDYSPLCDFKGVSAALVQNNSVFAPLIRDVNATDSVSVHMNLEPRGYIYDCDVDHPCKRDFHGQWVIVGNKLYLKDVDLHTPEAGYFFIRKRIWNKWDGDSADYVKRIEPPHRELLERVEAVTGRQFSQEGLLFADWFTGRLLGETDRNPNIRISPDRRSHTAVIIEVEKGVIKNIRKKHVTPLFYYDFIYNKGDYERALMTFGEKVIW